MRQSTATQRTKTMACSECGKPMTVGSNKRKAPRCIECGLARAIANNRQMVERSGEHYENWRNAMLRHLDVDT